MANYEIKIYEIQSDHLLAIPTFYKRKFIAANSRREVEKYVLDSIRDTYGNKMKRNINKLSGFDFISRTGAVKIKELKFKTLNQ